MSAIAQQSERYLTRQQVAAAFNEWMRRFTLNPDEYEREFIVATRFCAQLAEGGTPTYGDAAAEYLFRTHAEVSR